MKAHHDMQKAMLLRKFPGSAEAMNTPDIRWIQRLNHFAKAFSQLQEAVELAQQRQREFD
jgi:hypothetical protein